MLARSLFLVTLGISLGLLLLEGSSEFDFLLPFSLACSAVTLLPFALSSRPVLSRPVWMLASLSVFSGFLVRSVGIRLSDSWFDFFYTPTPPSSHALGYVFASICALTLGYLAASSIKPAAERTANHVALKSALAAGRFLPGLLILGISLLSIAAFVRQTGGLSLDNISGKRGIFLDLQSGSTTGSLILLRSLNELPLTLIVLLVSSGAFFGSDRVTRWIGAVLWISLIAAGLAIPLISSQREVLVAFTILGGVVLVRRGNFSKIKLAAVLLSMSLAFGVVSELRSGGGEIQVTSPERILVSSADSLFRNRNLADLSKTARIVDSVGGNLEIDNGKRQFGAILGVVPRAIWPSKPVIGTGPEVAVEVYGESANGVPAGVIAESYWSFGVGGVLIVFLVGFAGGIADGQVARSGGPVAYAVVVLIAGPFLLDALGVGLGNALTGLLIRSVQVALCSYLVRTFSALRSLPRETALA